MRKVVVYELLSLDGVAEEPDRFFADWDEAMDANLAAVIAAQDSVVLGRRSYDDWAGYWPGSDIEPFATFINAVAKYVATSTPLDRTWANTTGVDDELRLVIAPATAGGGRRFLDGVPAIRLESIESTTSPTGSLLLHYRV